MFGIEQAFAATDQEVVAAGILGGSVMVLMLLYVALIVLLIIARWKIFTKAGEAGWKSLIPIYSDYVQWRISWRRTGMFWLMLLLIVGGYMLFLYSGAFVATSSGQYVATGTGNTMMVAASGIMLLVGMIIGLVSIYKMMRAFGHGGGWTLLYLLFPNIMLLVLGFGSSVYYGPQD